jgi:hypothetical protein
VIAFNVIRFQAQVVLKKFRNKIFAFESFRTHTVEFRKQVELKNKIVVCLEVLGTVKAA